MRNQKEKILFFTNELALLIKSGLTFTKAIEIILKEEKKSAGELASEFNLSGATVSYHLTQLKKAGLILESRHKNFIYYELNASVFEEVLVWIYGLGGKDNESR